MPQVKWRPKALADLERLHQFLYTKDEAAARRAAASIAKATKSLATTPKLGRPLVDGTARRELAVRFAAGAYVIRYILDENVVLVVRVWHSREHR
jgi:plasmid stabilization system protein ParE